MTEKKKVWVSAVFIIVALSVLGCADVNELRSESFQKDKEAEARVISIQADIIMNEQKNADMRETEQAEAPYPDFDLTHLSIISKEEDNDKSGAERIGEPAEDIGNDEGYDRISEVLDGGSSGAESIDDPDTGYTAEMEGGAGGSSASDIEQDYSGESVSELVESGSDYGSETGSCGDEEFSSGTDTQDSGEPEGLTYLGTWTTTAYCPCEICCGVWATGCTASGVMATPNHTVACGSLPFGAQVMIDGVIYTVEDTGVEGEWIDIFFSSHEEALSYGMQMKEVYLVG